MKLSLSVIAGIAVGASAFQTPVVPRSTSIQWQQQQNRQQLTRNVVTELGMARANAIARGRAKTIQDDRPVMNDEITFQELRVVTPNPKGKDVPLGVMTRSEALTKARELGNLDLILINDKSDPPVCKIVDYSKYRYMQDKKAKELKKNSKGTEIKEVKMSYKIDSHDYDVRVKNASKFLKQGNRVKCTVMFRGREVQHDNLGFDLLERMAADLDETAVREGKPKREGKNLMLILQPKAEVMKSLNEQKRKEEKAKKQKRAEGFAKRMAMLEAQGINTDGMQPTQEEKDAIQSLEDLLDAGDDDDDEFDDDDDDMSLDELLGGDSANDELFSL